MVILTKKYAFICIELVKLSHDLTFIQCILCGYFPITNEHWSEKVRSDGNHRHVSCVTCFVLCFSIDLKVLSIDMVDILQTVLPNEAEVGATSQSLTVNTVKLFHFMGTIFCGLTMVDKSVITLIVDFKLYEIFAK